MGARGPGRATRPFRGLTSPLVIIAVWKALQAQQIQRDVSANLE